MPERPAGDFAIRRSKVVTHGHCQLEVQGLIPTDLEGVAVVVSHADLVPINVCHVNAAAILRRLQRLSFSHGSDVKVADDVNLAGPLGHQHCAIQSPEEDRGICAEIFFARIRVVICSSHSSGQFLADGSRGSRGFKRHESFFFFCSFPPNLGQVGARVTGHELRLQIQPAWDHLQDRAVVDFDLNQTIWRVRLISDVARHSRP
mmetsp:Transcript_19487/g.34752  ORF Transcript_19487/g.34752 Transcript_19487/m.34752 type:complete len:204 (-) Transcript_19487:1725-2336(-)